MAKYCYRLKLDSVSEDVYLDNDLVKLGINSLFPKIWTKRFISKVLAQEALDEVYEVFNKEKVFINIERSGVCG